MEKHEISPKRVTITYEVECCECKHPVTKTFSWDSFTIRTWVYMGEHSAKLALGSGYDFYCEKCGKYNSIVDEDTPAY